jgi:hypothetical protein
VCAGLQEASRVTRSMVDYYKKGVAACQYGPPCFLVKRVDKIDPWAQSRTKDECQYAYFYSAAAVVVDQSM